MASIRPPGRLLRSRRSPLLAGAAVIAAASVAAAAWFALGAGRPRTSGPFAVAVTEIAPDRLPNSPPLRIWRPIEPSTDDQPRPLVLYAASWGGLRDENDVLLADLASHGFVAVATDDVFYDAVQETAGDWRDEAARTSRFRLGSAQEFAAFHELGLRRARLGREKLARALDRLQTMPADLAPARIDLSRIAVVGMSHGGAVAGAALASDERIKAAVNLDGWVIGTEGMRLAPGKPLLGLYADPGPDQPASPPAAARDWVLLTTRLDFEAQLLLSSRSAARTYLINGASHGDFKDTLYEQARWLRWRPWRHGVIGVDEMRQALHGVVRAFLLSSLSDSANVDWRALAASAPAMRELDARDGLQD